MIFFIYLFIENSNKAGSHFNMQILLSNFIILFIYWK